MGFFDKRRRAKALQVAESAAAAAEQDLHYARIALQAASLELAQDSAPGIIPKKGERFYLVVQGAGSTRRSASLGNGRAARRVSRCASPKVFRIGSGLTEARTGRVLRS